MLSWVHEPNCSGSISIMRYLGLGLIPAIFLFFISACSNTDSHLKPRSLEKYTRVLISNQALSASGIEHFSDNSFLLVIANKYFYLMNSKDYLIAQYNESGGNPLNVFIGEYGQGPTDLLVPRSLFNYGKNKVGIYDVRNQKILVLDSNLKYLEEINCKKNFVEIYSTQRGLIALLDFKSNQAMAILDDSLTIKQEFIEANKKIPSEKFYPQLLNIGFYLNTAMVSHSYRLFPYKKCAIEIYDIESMMEKLTLNWEQPFSPTPKDIDNRKNLYFCFYVGKHDQYFVVETIVNKTLKSLPEYQLLIFNEKGKLLLIQECPYVFIHYCSDEENSKVFFMDENENISYIDIKELMK